MDTPDDIGSYTYEDILNVTFKVINSADCYQYDSEYQIWTDKTDNEKYMKNLVQNGEDLKVVGVVQPVEGAAASALSSGIGYTKDLSRHVAEAALNSEIVQQQLDNPDVDVFTNEAFGQESGQSELNMDSLFSIDEEALKEVFGFDESALTEGMDDAFDFSGYKEAVFCGYGEPTMALDKLIAVSKYVRSKYPAHLDRDGKLCPGIRLRLNTNGLGDLINKRSIAREVCQAIDIVSISLNMPDAKSHNEVVRPAYGEKAFDAMLKFAEDCK